MQSSTDAFFGRTAWLRRRRAFLPELFLRRIFRYEVVPMDERRARPMSDDGQYSASPAPRVAPAESRDARRRPEHADAGR